MKVIKVGRWHFSPAHAPTARQTSTVTVQDGMDGFDRRDHHERIPTTEAGMLGFTDRESSVRDPEITGMTSHYKVTPAADHTEKTGNPVSFLALSYNDG
jgi:hypothetical protein